MTTPRNLDECLVELLKISSSLKEEIRQISEEGFLSAFCNMFGRNIQNSWGLWTNSDLRLWFFSQGVYHADDMSSIIMVSFYRYLRDIPIDLPGQIAGCDACWKEKLGSAGYERMKLDILLSCCSSSTVAKESNCFLIDSNTIDNIEMIFQELRVIIDVIEAVDMRVWYKKKSLMITELIDKLRHLERA